MPIAHILSELRALLPELVAAENYRLARSVREVISLLEPEDGRAADADDRRSAA